ncbi:peptidoglycan glycosyltransferase [Megasphaera cerevisiae DSM 20462]|jgi:penicillin-binding protein 2|uniref:Peptidoglycan glycosyltransferase n=1 Tax=Megasphaera cerevisiae DSM 20462 TaxID=1122219 RepID=A0A0J6X011_9FIRM|nr:penicillin-binding protein 2 [Megasphaera cerevisiae]KMO87858.1 peptidoglycan glycosyltransferase [Megasphaera cerevisiae DSM 20462]MCI1750138.1 penicillin-binding protein 2 [Megasphaera cerevisiae]OKY54354.1 penicillin-binding protein 2 [Megasphaera cerevisiae]SJZ42111.1 penicillin-binding protein 2 [Megasphaera cerevisiae DSM 20462]
MLEALMKKKNQDGRFRYLYWIIVGIFAVLICRLVYLQLFAGEYYHTLAEGNRLRAIPIAAMRGIMYDRNGQILVGSRPSFMATYVPTKNGMSDNELKELAGLLNVPDDKLYEKVKKVKSSYVPTVLANDLTPDIVTKIEERRNELPGVSIDVQPIRYYPYNEMAAQVFGYVGQIDEEDMKRLEGQEGVSNITQIGRAGLESYYDDLLRGKDGGRQVEVDATGSPVKEMERKNPIAGHNMHLTIDLNLQEAAEKAMDAQVANGIGTQGIAAVAIDPNTGAVLAMASRPAFNPNWFTRGITEKEWAQINNNPNHPMENRAIAGQYPPGSTFKLITGAAALELKKVTPDEMIFDSGRHWLVDMRNAGGEALGWINFTEALAKSDNVYFYEMGRRVGIDKLAEYARMFGMGKKTGIALRGEATGLVASEEYKQKVFHQDWYLGDTFNSAIGQGFQLVTPLQAAMIVSEVANGGIQYRPFVVSRIDNLDGTPYKIFAPEQIGTLSVSKSTLDLIREGMRNVAEESGTAGSLFADFPIQVAGKTGTAENFSGRDHGWFVSYAPYDHPRIVIAVLVEQGGYGIASAGPIVKSMLEEFFHVGTYADGGLNAKNKHKNDSAQETKKEKQ